MIISHKIRLDPTLKQEEYFKKACGTARFTWNRTLALWNEQYKAGEKPLPSMHIWICDTWEGEWCTCGRPRNCRDYNEMEGKVRYICPHCDGYDEDVD